MAPDDPMLRPGTDRCKCTVCGLYFNSTTAFTKHRQGPFAPVGDPDTRRCMTVDELKRRRWVQSETGHWQTMAPRHATRGKATPASDTAL